MEAAQPAYKKNHCIVSKNTFQIAYRDALHCAQKALRSLDITACCANGGAVLTNNATSADTINLRFLNRPMRITLPDLCFSADQDVETASIWEQIIILHYLANSRQAGLHDTLINFRRLRDGALYAEPFERRCIQPLLATFGTKPGRLIKAAAPLDGKPADFADYAVRIPALPRLDFICCLWKSDAEFGPDATILFDSGAENFLCAEDIAVLCQQIVLKLIKNNVS